MTQYILDSSAIACYLRGEDGSEQLETLIADPDNTFFLHAINWIELQYLQRRGQFPKEKPVQEFIAKVNVTVSSDLSQTFSERVVTLKADHAPIALGDCFAVALAQTIDAALITTDRGELEKIASANLCQILFLR